ncbi:sensor histidine kinase [Nonomuraea sp. SBT364]|uniref:sensor histidine kinase n=1 Tax=Nonomuraea sp. SBT364 TaxID=1580530 RepID=UPI0018CF1F10|nr:histidine kinase [Nonomuraea sp. SBT364]
MRESPYPAEAAVDSFLSRHQLSGDAVLAVLLALPLGLVSVSLLRASDSPLSLRLLAGAALLVLHACVVPRRLSPLAAYGVAAAAMLTLVLLPPLHDPAGAYYPAVLLPSSLVFGLMLYTVSGRLGLLPGLACLAVALAGVVLVLARLWDPASWGGSSGGYDLVAWRIGLSAGLFAVTACLWSLGRLSRVRTLFLAELRAKAERAETDRARERAEAARAERDRISREMHDVVSHSLAVMVSQAEGGRLSAPGSPGADVFATIAGVGRDALRDMRGLLGVLRADGGTAPQPGLGDLADLLDHVHSAGVRVSVQEIGDARPLRPAVDLTAYRVIQEGLTNVIKHAGPSATAALTLAWRPDGLHITVEDDGTGPAGAEAGAGLTGMRERLRMVGGTLETGGRPGAGFRLSAAVPYEPRSLPSSGS